MAQDNHRGFANRFICAPKLRPTERCCIIAVFTGFGVRIAPVVDHETSTEKPATQTPDYARTASPILDGPIRSAVLWLALPVLGEQALNAAVTWNDTFVAGRISAMATGAVGLASYISWLM